MPEQNQHHSDDLIAKTRREIFLIWLVFFIGSLIVLFLFHRYSPRLIDYLESRNPRIFIDKANKFILDKKYDEALSQIQKAIQTYPSDPSFHLLLGDVYERKGDFEAAVAAFEHAQKLNPSDWNPYYRIGVTKLTQKRYSESVEALLKAAERNKTERWLYNALGWAAYEDNQLDIAYDGWKQASFIVPANTSYYYYLALIHNKRNQWEQSLALYEKVIELDSTQTPAFELAAESAYQLGNTPLAKNYWTQVISRNPNSISALHGLGKIAIKSSFWNEARDYLEKVRTLQPENKEILSDLISIYRNQGNTGKVNQLQKLLQSS